MKKLIFAAFAAGAMVLAGCTKTEVTKVSESRAIQFDNFVSNAVKSELTTESISKFYVYGGYADNYDLFNGEEVTKNGNSWNYTTRYWIDETTDYNFAAYSDGGNKATATIALESTNNKHLNLTGYTLDNGDRDLVYAYQSEICYNDYNGTVNLTFYHILSKLVFQFTADESLQDITLTFSDIKLNNVNTVADFKGQVVDGNQIKYAAWSNWNTTTTAIENFTSTTNTNFEITGATEQNSFTTDPKFMIPQEVPITEENKFTLSFSVSVSGENADDYKISTTDPYNFSIELPVPTDKTQWEPGFSYIYAASLSVFNFNDQLEPIVFDQITVGGWETDINTDVDDIIVNE